MTTAQIKRILSGAGIDYSGITQIPKLRTIFINTPQGIDTRRDFIYFDFSNEMIKIKKYHAQRAAGRIGPCKFGDDSQTWVKAISSTFYMKHKEFKYSYPKAGDVLFTVNKLSGKITNKFTIKSAGSHYVEAESKIIFNSESEYLCFSTKEDFDIMVQDDIDKSVFIKYHPATKNKYDIYLDMNQVIGFEFTSERLGNS